MARYYNYFTGEWVNSPDKIKPRDTNSYNSLRDVGFELAAERARAGQTTPEQTEGTTDLQLEADVAGAEADTAAAIADSIQADVAARAADSAVMAASIGQGTLPPGTLPPRTTFVASDGTVFIDIDSKNRYEQTLANRERAGQSAFALLESEFSRFGMQSLVEPLRKFIKQGLSRDELVLELRKDPAYQQRFSANQARIDKGLRALSEAEYIGLEDQYQDVMRRYGLPESYYKKEALGRQPGFEQLIGFDVSPTELEERLVLGKKRVLESPPEVLQSLRQFYGDAIKDGDVLAYVLDPKSALENIKRKVAVSEIGAGAMQAGLGTTRERAEELSRFGITAEQSRAGYQQIAGGLQRGGQLAAIYDQTPYGQETAEKEIFGISGAEEARRKRLGISQLEKAEFSKTTGLTGGALSRERAGQY